MTRTYEFGILGGRELHEGPDPAQARARLLHEFRRLAVEFPRGLLERRGPYWVDTSTGNLLLPVEGATLHGSDHLPDNAHAAFAFTLGDDGMPLFLRHPTTRPFTLEQLEAAEQAAEHAAARRAEAEAETHRQFLDAQPRRPLTLADLAPDKPMPTLREALETLVELGCTVEPSEHGLAITAPQRYAANDGHDLTARQRVRDAARVLDAARELVHARLAEGRPLPDMPPPVGGGGAVT